MPFGVVGRVRPPSVSTWQSFVSPSDPGATAGNLHLLHRRGRAPLSELCLLRPLFDAEHTDRQLPAVANLRLTGLVRSRLGRLRRAILGADRGRYPIEDAGQFTASFDSVLAGAGSTPVGFHRGCPRRTGFAERFVLTARTDLTDRILIFGERHLRVELVVMTDQPVLDQLGDPHRVRDIGLAARTFRRCSALITQTETDLST